MPYRRVTVRACAKEDEAALFGLARRSFGERGGWSDDRTVGVICDETVFVAELDGRPAGFVALEPGDDVVRIDQLLVSPEHQGEGIGHQLIEWAEGYAISQRARALQIVVEDDNMRARDFYRRAGFVGAEPGLLELTLPQD